MLRFFRKRNRDKNMLQNWQIPLDADYLLIDNGDSIQFVNADESLVFYFSILPITKNSLVTDDVLAKMQPSVTRVENGWQFKGAKSGSREVLVCVFSFTNESDEGLVRELFAGIVYVGK